MKHATLSPSSAHRWLYCTASVAAIEAAALPYKSSRAADEGTYAHSWCEKLLKSGEDTQQHYIGMTDGRFTFDEEMAGRVQRYLDYVRPFITEGSEVYIENAWSLFYSPEENGYCDCAIYDPATKTVHTFDYKDGWTFVEAEANDQFRIYAECIVQQVEMFDEVEHIHCHVCQPKVNNFAHEELTREELAEYAEFVQDTVDGINGGCTTVYGPSDKACLWCPLKANCKDQAAHAADLIQVEFDDLTQEEPPSPPSVSGLTPTELANIYRHRKVVAKFLKQVEERAKELMDANELPGFKRVASLGNRAWTDKEAAAKFMATTLKLKKDERYTYKLLTPPQLEKVVDFDSLGTRAKNKLDSLIVRPETATIVHMSDKRDALPSVADEFENETTTKEEL